MPRVRHPKTRVQKIAEAVEALQLASEELHDIDLRTVKGDLQRNLRVFREGVDQVLEQGYAALQSDVPQPLHEREATASATA